MRNQAALYPGGLFILNVPCCGYQEIIFCFIGLIGSIGSIG